MSADAPVPAADVGKEEERWGGGTRNDPVVAGGGGRPLDPPEAEPPTRGDTRRPRSLEPRLDPPTQLGRAVEVTREIVAQPDLDRRRWRQPEGRVEGREALKMVERRLGRGGGGLQVLAARGASPA